MLIAFFLFNLLFRFLSLFDWYIHISLFLLFHQEKSLFTYWRTFMVCVFACVLRIPCFFFISRENTINHICVNVDWTTMLCDMTYIGSLLMTAEISDTVVCLSNQLQIFLDSFLFFFFVYSDGQKSLWIWYIN